MWKIGDKTVRVPLIQGGMGVGISLGRLAGTVAAQGGVGVISTAQIGFREEDFDRDPGTANLRAVRKEMARARAISPDGIIGYNIMVALRDYEAHVQAAVAAGADLIISGAGLPVELPRLTQGSRTKIAPIVSTEKSAKVILKYWDRKYQQTADLVVIEGPEAGGHLGFDREALDFYAKSDYMEEIRRILEAVRGYEKKFGKQNKKKILVVDDSGTMLRNVKGWLEESYQVTLANSGAMAIKYLSTNRPDLVLLDYEMPIVDGKQVLEMIRSEHDFADIPVMMLTNKGDKETIMQVMALKPQGYLLKSMEPSQIITSIDDFFE